VRIDLRHAATGGLIECIDELELGERVPPTPR
jgi:hypothetical protein